MSTIQNQLRASFSQAIKELYSIDADPVLVPTGSAQFGDYQCNAAMGIAKQLKSKPRDIAEAIKNKVNLSGIVDKLEIAGPGFINIYLSSAWLGQKLTHIAADPRLGVDKTPLPKRVVIDYPGINVAKEMHIGHLRPSNIGDAIARIIEFTGENLIRQNHIGDWGTAFGMLLAYMQETDGDLDSELSQIDAFYKAAKKRFDSDPAFADRARLAVVKLQAGSETEVAMWKKIVDISRHHMMDVLGLLSIQITPADERGESFYNPMLPGVVAELKDKGVAEESEGAIVVWVKPFETPLIIQKRDGGFGYGTTDLAALRYRTTELKADRLVYVTDNRQRQHFLQFSDAGRRAGWFGNASYDHVMFGTILGADGKPFKTKSGESFKLKEVLLEAIERARAIVDAKNPELPESQRAAIAKSVGIGGVKYFDLNKDRLTDYVFDWDSMLATEGNTAPYLQYAYARTQSIFRKAGLSPDAKGKIELVAPEEITLGKHILRLGEVIETVTRELKPHVLCTYLYELATKFSSFFENCPVLKSEEPTRSSRLAICAVTAKTLALGLDLLGIEHPEQM